MSKVKVQTIITAKSCYHRQTLRRLLTSPSWLNLHQFTVGASPAECGFKDGTNLGGAFSSQRGMVNSRLSITPALLSGSADPHSPSPINQGVQCNLVWDLMHFFQHVTKVFCSKAYQLHHTIDMKCNKKLA